MVEQYTAFDLRSDDADGIVYYVLASDYASLEGERDEWQSDCIHYSDYAAARDAELAAARAEGQRIQSLLAERSAERDECKRRCEKMVEMLKKESEYALEFAFKRAENKAVDKGQLGCYQRYAGIKAVRKILVGRALAIAEGRDNG